MKLHRLSMTAFGPFAGTETVDFEDLAQAGLYLIQGPTGAGKTSILDAICFALYAAVPGSRAGSRGTLRSDHAAAGTVPRVELELTVRGRRMRITRSPAFSRPKMRGEGETTLQATVLLQELVGDEWTTKGTRLDEVAQVVDDVVGLGLEQFVKVVLLPQGEFAAFLRATPEDRRGLLERLFDTSRFTDVEDWLATRRRESAASVESARTELRAGLQRVDDVLGDLDPLGPAETTAGSGPGDDATGLTVGPAEEELSPPWSELDARQVGQELDGSVSRVVDLASIALARADHAAGERDRASARLADAERTDTLQARARQAQDTLAAVAELAGQRDLSAQILEQARRARELAAHLSGLDTATTEAADTERREAAARAAVAEVCRALAEPDDGTDLPAVRLLAEEVGSAAAALTRAGAALDRGRSSRSRADEHAALVTAQSAEVERLQQVACQHEERRKTLAAQLEALSAVASKLEAHRSRDSALRRAVSLATSRSQAAERIDVLTDQESVLAPASLADGEEVVRLHRLRIEGMAAELAIGLVDGQDCPVCGSAEHPRPAEGTATVSSHQIEAAERRAAASRTAHDEVRHELATVRARHDTQVEQLGACLSGLGLAYDPADVTIDQLQGLTDETRRAATEAQEAGQARDDAEQERQALATSAERTRADQEAARNTLAAAAATRDAALAEARSAVRDLTKLMREHHEHCPCADPALTPDGPDSEPAAGGLDEPPASTLEMSGQQLQDIVARHRAATELLAGLAAALQERASAHRVLARARDALQTALTENGFADAEAARAASRSDDQMAALERELREFDRRRETAEAVLAEPEVMAAQAKDVPDLEALTQLERDARESHTAADRAAAHYARAESRLRQLSREIHTTLERLDTQEAAHRSLQDLAECVAGTGPDNELKMRLSAFVLAARLEEVARYANERLGVMSDGRYTLRHSDARAARGARSGLGLRVTDAWTGIERETNTLSGGEAFLASLALALGLGDAVRAEAGGLDLQTLFVDEGFGSLDEESLEHVMGILDDLRAGGRAVGIVSHVPELRQRIRAQVRVTKTPAGSHLSVCTTLADEPAA
jgi:exonuclease SbcC